MYIYFDVVDPDPDRVGSTSFFRILVEIGIQGMPTWIRINATNFTMIDVQNT
jgi:hypothetical protein